MTDWQWWWLEEGDDEQEWQGEFRTRDEAKRAAQRDVPVGARFFVIEARSSTAAKHEWADSTPFIRTRNRETWTNGPSS